MPNVAWLRSLALAVARSTRLSLTAVLAAFVLGACGGSDPVAVPGNVPASGPGPTTTTARPATVDASLNQLGVSTAESPRLSNDGVALPDDFSPFGQRIKVAINDAGETHFGAPMEVIAGGFALKGAAESFVVLDNLTVPAVGGEIVPSAIYSLSQADAPWAREDRAFEKSAPVTLRDSAGGDLDGDGYDELIIVHEQSGQVLLKVANLANRTVPDETRVLPIQANALPIGDVRVRTADLDQDGKAEIIVAVSQAAAPGRPTYTMLGVFEWAPGGLIVKYTREFQSTLATAQGVHVSTVLKPGNIDYDAADEIVLVLNEFAGAQAIPDAAATRFYVLDDAKHGFAELLADTLSVSATAATYQAQVADVAIGDIDGDFVNEIVFGGLADLTIARSCNFDADGGPGSLRYLLMTYEFNGTTIEKTKAASSSDADWDQLYPGYCSGSPATRAIRFLSVNILDFDGDRVPDIQANQFIFSGIPEPGWVWHQRATFSLPSGTMIPDENTDLVFDRNSATFLVNDVDGNGRSDIVSYRGGDNAIRIYSWRQPLNASGEPIGPPQLYQQAFIPASTTDPDGGGLVGRNVNPMLVMLDADGKNEGDVQTLQFLSHQFGFTEPLILAAIAAPPCRFDIGQNTDACTSSWGTAEVTGTDASREISVKAGIIVGYEWEAQAGGGIGVVGSVKIMGLSVKGTFAEELGSHRSESYEVTRSVSFETGPMETSVVYASIPYDFYNYEVIARTYVSTYDPGSVRELQRLGLPRTPITRMAAVDYYNAHTTDTAVKIDGSVFQHTIGRLDSYPTRLQRDEILSTRRSQLDNIRLACPGCWQVDPDAPLSSGNSPRRQFSPVMALPGLVSDAVGVGQGSGSTQVAIDFSRSSSFGNSLAKSAEVEVELNFGGVVGGVAVGGGLSHSTNITHGSSTTYVGTVGSIDAAHFANEQYRFGMFTYLQGDSASGQEFEVINYWVE
jgi:FG-GAP-like repeat